MNEQNFNAKGCANFILAVIFGLVVIILIIFSSCSCEYHISKLEKKDCPSDTVIVTDVQVKTITRDSFIQIDGDRTWKKLLFKCDSLGNVKAKLIDELTGRISTLNLNLEYGDDWQLVDTFFVECEVDSQGIYVKWKELYIKEIVERTIKAKVENPLKYAWNSLKWYYKVLIIIGLVLFIVLIFSILVLKFK